MTTTLTDSRGIAILGVPSSAGARRRGQERGPDVLRAAGLVKELVAAGLRVVDLGDVREAVFRPDPENPTCQNAELVRSVARAVASQVEQAGSHGNLPVVLGGDCTITIGVVSGLARNGSRLGLIYVDGDLDLNTPETTPSGIFDGMVTAHLLGRGAPELTRAGSRYPLLGEEDLVYFGYDANGGGVDLPELVALERSAALRYPVEKVRSDPTAAAHEALANIVERVDRFVVHFDIDVTDLPVADFAHTGGLSLHATVEALKIFVESPKCAALVVTEYNPEFDADRSSARRLVAGLRDTLSNSRSHPY